MPLLKVAIRSSIHKDDDSVSHARPGFSVSENDAVPSASLPLPDPDQVPTVDVFVPSYISLNRAVAFFRRTSKCPAVLNSDMGTSLAP